MVTFVARNPQDMLHMPYVTYLYN